MKTILLSLVTLLVLANFVCGKTKMNDEQGLKIISNNQPNENHNSLFVQGELSTFVNSGSQYATWGQFPRAIQYKIIDLDTDEVYTSIDMMLSISESGNENFERYGKEPCNQVVSKEFSVSLHEIYFQNAPKNAICNFELQAEYAGHKSNILKFIKTPFQMKSF